MAYNKFLVGRYVGLISSIVILLRAGNGMGRVLFGFLFLAIEGHSCGEGS